MSKPRLLAKSDLQVVRPVVKYIPLDSMKEVIQAATENGYVLYSYLANAVLLDSDDIHDAFIADVLGWSDSKAARYRVLLESSGFIRFLKYGPKVGGMTKLVVGKELVALSLHKLYIHPEGQRAYAKLKQFLKLETVEDVVSNLELMQSEFDRNPKLYK